MSTADSCRLLAFADMVKHKAAGGIAVGLATPFPHFRGRAVHRLKDRRTRPANWSRVEKSLRSRRFARCGRNSEAET